MSLVHLNLLITQLKTQDWVGKLPWRVAFMHLF